MTDTDVLTAHDLSRHIKYIWHTDEQSVEEIKKRDAAIEARAVAAKDDEIRRLREALGFYASSYNWIKLRGQNPSTEPSGSICVYDNGKKAREALKSSGETL